MLNQDELIKILEENNVKALKKCIQNNEITDEMYKMMFLGHFYFEHPKIRYVFNFFKYESYYDEHWIQMIDILLKNVPIHYLSNSSHIYPGAYAFSASCTERLVSANLIHVFDHSFVQFTLLHYPSTLARRLFEAISKSGRSDVIVEKKFIEEVCKYNEQCGYSDEIEETIKNCCIEIKNGDYILAPYKLKNVISDRTIEEFKSLPLEFIQDFIMLNPVRLSTFEEVKPILESIKDKTKNANINEVNKVNYMLSHIVREYWSYGLKDTAHDISDLQADICLPSNAIDPISNTLNYVKLEESSLVNVMKCGIK